MEWLFTYAYLFLGTAMLVLTLLQVSARKRIGLNCRLAALFLCMGYICLYYGLYRVSRFVWAPGLLYSDVVATYLLGPLLYSYAKSLELGNLPFQARRVPLYLPGGAVFLCFLILRPQAGLAPTDLIGMDPNYGAVPLVDLLNSLGDLYFFSFVAASLLVVLRLYRAGTPTFRREFRCVLGYFAVGFSTILVFIAGHAAGSERLLAFGVLLNGFNSIGFFILSCLKPSCTLRPAKSGPRY